MFSKILKETEDSYAKVSLDRTLCNNELTSLRKEMERQYQEKLHLEDAILSAIRDKMTIDKVSELCDSSPIALRDSLLSLSCFKSKLKTHIFHRP